MAFNTLLAVFSLIAMGDGVAAIVAPSPFVHFIWVNRVGPEANLFVQGWGACSVALAVLGWAGRGLRDPTSRHLLALAFFTYFAIVSALWLTDALSRGWTPVSAASFACLVLFAVAFGYFRFGQPRVGLRRLTSPA
jgi:hypothetical protein